MLLANGSYNGKSYKKEVISVEELIAGVKDTPIAEYLRKDLVKITHPSDRVGIDKLNNDRIRRRASASISAIYNAVDKKGNRLSLRYFDHEHLNEQNVPSYEPRRISVFQDEAMENGLDMTLDREKSVFMLLSPQNADSPFHNDMAMSSFRIHDPEKENKILVQQENELLDTLFEIRQMAKTDPDNLKRRAQGIKIGNETIIGINFDDIDSVVSSMNAMARSNPKEFSKAFNDLGNITRGLVADAFRRNILEYTVENLETVVKYKGTEMCRFSKIYEPIVGVVTYIGDNDIRTWTKNLSNDVADIDAEMKLKKNQKK